MNYSSKKSRSNIDIVKDLSVVVKIIIFTAIVSIIGFILLAVSESYVEYFALMPQNILSGKFVWTLITHMFVHGGIGHLLINMFVLFSLGGLSEKIIGRKRFFWFYIISGLFAGILSVILAGSFGNTAWGARVFGKPDIYMVGASGAIFAIAGLYVILLPKLKFMIIFLPFFSLPAYIMVPLVLAIMWLLSIIGNWPIGNVAHFGGFIAGIAYGFYLRTKYQRKVARLQKMFR